VNLVVRGAGGTITVPAAVLAEIATRAAEGVEGVRVRRRRSFDVETATVTLGIAAGRGDALTSVGERVQEQVATTVSAMCGLDVTVDVAIEELE
jgi:uncharacterized alkaline shock family protein YloU